MDRWELKSTVLAGVLLLVMASSASGVTITVTTTDDEMNTDGDCSLREALMSAGTDTPYDACTAGSGRDTVFLPAGEYILTSGYLWLSTELTIEGEDQASTVIDGNYSTEIFRRQGPQAVVEIRNLTVANGSGPAGGFGAALIQGADYDTTFRNVTIEWCQTQNRGGAIYMADGIVRLIDCRILNNQSVEYGGAIYMGGGRLEAVRTLFFGNNVSSDVYGGGGAIFDHSTTGSVELEYCTFTTNTARYGGAFAGLGKLVISGSLFFSNHARSAGGAVDAAATTTIVNSTFSTNWAGTSDPSSAGSGGAIRSYSDVEIYNSTFYNNLRYFFGTFEGNSLSVSGALIANSIFEVSSGANCNIAMTSGGHNITSDSSCGLNGPGDLSDTDPQLTLLIDNGGPTMTHRPLSGSPAIDSGDPLGCFWDHDSDPATPEVEVRIDQRGFLRPYDGDGDLIPVCDPGAVEYGATATLFADGFESGNTDGWSLTQG